jgi:hypothetical protein
MSLVLVSASIHVEGFCPWVAEAVLLASGGHGGPRADSVGIGLLASIHVARYAPTWGCRTISEVCLSQVTL